MYSYRRFFDKKRSTVTRLFSFFSFFRIQSLSCPLTATRVKDLHSCLFGTWWIVIGKTWDLLKTCWYSNSWILPNRFLSLKKMNDSSCSFSCHGIISLVQEENPYIGEKENEEWTVLWRKTNLRSFLSFLWSVTLRFSTCLSTSC